MKLLPILFSVGYFQIIPYEYGEYDDYEYYSSDQSELEVRGKI